MVNQLNNLNLAASFRKKPAIALEPSAEVDVAGSFQTHLSTDSESKVLTEEASQKSVNGHCKTDVKIKKDRTYQAFTVICNKETVRKVKAIAKKEGLRINAVVQAMYNEGISRYEHSHGAIDSGSKQKSAEEVLFAR